MDKSWGVYVHVPFCAARCTYCDFCTYSGKDSLVDAYFGTLLDEIRNFWACEAREPWESREPRESEKVNCCYADTVFFGGGTPSYVDSAYIRAVLALTPRPEVDSGERLECTVEANPGTLSPSKLADYRNAGVNRLSMGLQSTHERYLRLLGRIHTADDFNASVRDAKDAGFENVSADLMFGLPGQSLSEWAESLEKVVALGIRHISCYSLSLEEGTALLDAVRRGEVPAPDEDADREMYHYAREYLRGAGLPQYELSNFAAPGYECRHNLKYWTGGRYRGFGAAAHSYDLRVRCGNTGCLEDYIACPKNRRNYSEIITETEREKEFIILRLRLTRGFTEVEFRSEFNFGFYEKYAETVNRLKTEGLLASTAGSFRLTPKGMDLANRVFVEFM